MLIAGLLPVIRAYRVGRNWWLDDGKTCASWYLPPDEQHIERIRRNGIANPDGRCGAANGR